LNRGLISDLNPWVDRLPGRPGSPLFLSSPSLHSDLAAHAASSLAST